uniref:Uncharacterized protein n=1 Tax=Ficedula albicollis TaxID=59894 RepID=A0A803V1S3_FICAL
MSTNQRKRRGEAADSGQAQKRSRLLAPSTGGASEPEPGDFEESGTLSFEFAGEELIVVTADSSDSEDINLTGSDSGSVVQWVQNQQHPLVSRAADNSPLLLASDDDLEPRDSDGYVRDKVYLQSLISDISAWSSDTLSSPNWMDEYSEWEQDQEYPLLSTPVDDSVVLLASDDDEELRDSDGLFGPLTSVLYNDCFLWQLEQNQQYLLVSRAADNSSLLLASDEEEGRNNNSAWSSDTLSSPNWMDEYSEWEQDQEYPLLSTPVDDSVVLLASDDDEELRDSDGLFGPLTSVLYNDCFLWQLEQNQQYLLVSRAADNSSLLLASDEEEGRNNNSAWSSDTLSSPNWMDEYSEIKLQDVNNKEASCCWTALS